jgi:cytochrome c biogenesis protein CcdA
VAGCCEHGNELWGPIKCRGTVRLQVLGFICGVAEVFDLLGCFTASVGSLLLTFRNMEQNFHFLNTRK